MILFQPDDRRDGNACLTKKCLDPQLAVERARREHTFSVSGGNSHDQVVNLVTRAVASTCLDEQSSAREPGSGFLEWAQADRSCPWKAVAKPGSKTVGDRSRIRVPVVRRSRRRHRTGTVRVWIWSTHSARQAPFASSVMSPYPTRCSSAVLDNARFAPSGGNRQGWRVVVVRDRAAREQLRDLYLEGWYEYLAMGAAGLVPWAPVTDREAETAARAKAPEFAAAAAAGRGGFAEHLDEVPVLMLVVADLRALAAVDRDLDRYTLVGGASIYPFCWSVLLAARDEGLGGVMTTMVVKCEDDVRELFGLPAEVVVAGLVALGFPEHQPRRLKRRQVSDFTTVDRYDGPAFG